MMRTGVSEQDPRYAPLCAGLRELALPAEQATVETQQAGDAGDEILVERNDRGERAARLRITQPQPMLAGRIGDDNMPSIDPG